MHQEDNTKFILHNSLTAMQILFLLALLAWFDIEFSTEEIHFAEIIDQAQ